MKRILIPVCLIALACNVGAQIPMPARIGGILSIDGIPINFSPESMLIEVVRTNGTSLEPTATALSTDGTGWYLIDIPIYHATSQPGGIEAGSGATLKVSINGQDYPVESPSNGNITVGSAGSITQIDLNVASPVVSGLWSDLPRDQNGWFQSPWIGWMQDHGAHPYYAHLEHGWLYFSGDDSASLYIYDFGLGCWYWTAATYYPWIYKYGTNEGWYFYFVGGAYTQRWFQRASDGGYVQEADIDAQPAPAGFSLIPAGSFTMGSPVDELGRDDDETQHEVTLTRSFYLQQTEVTWAQWNEVRDWAMQNGYSIASGRNGYGGDASGNHPVTNVEWYDVEKWLNARSEREGLTPCYTVGGVVVKTGTSTPTCDFAANGYRLPTEAEWEYACRAGTTTAFYTGEISEMECGTDPNLDVAGWYCGNSGSITHPVGQKQPNAWGLYDMHGNVWEWCADWYGSYPSGSVVDPTGPSSGTSRVIRGSSFTSLARSCRSAFRLNFNTITNYSLGFRPARSQFP